MKSLLLLLLVFVVSIQLQAQQKEITGKVIAAADGLPLPGANVIVKGTTNGVQTNFDGEYKITANIGDQLVFSFVGMKNKEVTVADSNVIDISLENDATLDEVVVMAYGARRSNHSTSYTTRKTMSESEIKRQNQTAYHNQLENQLSATSGVNNSLQGQAAGVNINHGSGQPGSSSKIILRGVSSLPRGTEPLYVIDGVPQNHGFEMKIDPKEIKSISVIKDAGATAIYGNRGSNGVVIITTDEKTQDSGYDTLYIVDGMPIPKFNNDIIKKIPEDVIDSKKIYEKSEAKQKFGKVAKNGCIVITTKKGNFRIENDESYAVIDENDFLNVNSSPLSTFSIDVDKASYSNIRRMINNGQSIPADAVKIEEMINYFDYNYPQPTDNHPFSINTEVSKTPWNVDTKLVRIGLQGKTYSTQELPASNLTFLIDVSGSMSSENKLPLLKSAFKLLVNQLRKEDRVSIVVYAGAAGLVLQSTSGDDKNKIIRAIENLQAGGSTAGGAGIDLAYKIAQQNFIKNGNNRVILATDGDFNIGASSDRAMVELIEEKRKSGVFLSVLGFGYGNLKDSKLETLADKGNGNHAYIDTMQEAQKTFGKEFGGTLFTIAKDVKIQIEFNPKKVQAYRLIGYENRLLADEDFEDDTKDAGELGSGHTVTALYEVIPIGIKGDYLKTVPDLKYSERNLDEQFADELFTVKFRYKKPDGDTSIEMVHVQKDETKEASDDLKFASAVALFGMELRQSKYNNEAGVDKILSLAKQGKGNDVNGYRSEFIRLVESMNMM